MWSSPVLLGRPNPAKLRARTAGWRQVWVWLPAVIAVALIATESTPVFSADATDKGLRPLVEHWTGHIDNNVWWWMHHLFRKGGHFAGFGLVCLAFMRAWLLTLGVRPGLGLRAWRLRSCLLGIACTTVVASLDEWHQTFLPSRTGAFTDVVIDAAGATLMCILVWAVLWREQTLHTADLSGEVETA